MILSPVGILESTDEGKNQSERQVENKNPVENLLKGTSLETILTQIHDKLALSTGMDDEGDNISRVLQKATTVKELVQVKSIPVQVWAGAISETKATFKRVHVFVRWEAFNFDGTVLSIGILSNICKLCLELFDRHFRFEIALTVQSCCFDESFVCI